MGKICNQFLSFKVEAVLSDFKGTNPTKEGFKTDVFTFQKDFFFPYPWHGALRNDR